MSSNVQSDEANASSISTIEMTAEEKKKYEDFCNLYPAIRSIIEAPPISDGLFYKPNSESNPLVISDDSDDDYDHPLVVLRPLEASDFEVAWDSQPDLHTEQIVDYNEEN